MHPTGEEAVAQTGERISGRAVEEPMHSRGVLVGAEVPAPDVLGALAFDELDLLREQPSEPPARAIGTVVSPLPWNTRNGTRYLLVSAK